MEEMIRALREWNARVAQLKPLDADTLEPGHTLLVVIDMVNGFAREGALASSQVAGIIPSVAGLAGRCARLGIPRLSLSDCHTAHSGEFAAFPPHCLEGTREAELVDELKAVPGFTMVTKNSTNGFLEEGYLRWLGTHPAVNTFVVAGDCTDICIQQFAQTLKCHFNRLDMPSRVIVPADAVATYDAPGHSAALCHVAALNSLMLGGVEVVSAVE